MLQLSGCLGNVCEHLEGILVALTVVYIIDEVCRNCCRHCSNFKGISEEFFQIFQIFLGKCPRNFGESETVDDGVGARDDGVKHVGTDRLD